MLILPLSPCTRGSVSLRFSFLLYFLSGGRGGHLAAELLLSAHVPAAPAPQQCNAANAGLPAAAQSTAWLAAPASHLALPSIRGHCSQRLAVSATPPNLHRQLMAATLMMTPHRPPALLAPARLPRSTPSPHFSPTAIALCRHALFSTSSGARWELPPITATSVSSPCTTGPCHRCFGLGRGTAGTGTVLQPAPPQVTALCGKALLRPSPHFPQEKRSYIPGTRAICLLRASFLFLDSTEEALAI